MYTCRAMDNQLFDQEPQEQQPNSGVKKVIDLLISWNLPQLCEKFQEEEINEEALRCLNAAEIVELIPKVGPRSIFRNQLEKWRFQSKQSVKPNKVLSNSNLLRFSPVIKEESESWHSDFMNETDGEEIDEDLLKDYSEAEIDWQQLNIHNIINNSTEGKQSKLFYEKNKYLDGHSRRLCVQVITNSVIEQNVQIPPEGFLNLAQQLIEIFPTEHLDTYYVPRNGPANPRGMLHNCYFNTKRRLKHQRENGLQNKKYKLISL